MNRRSQRQRLSVSLCQMMIYVWQADARRVALSCLKEPQKSLAQAAVNDGKHSPQGPEGEEERRMGEEEDKEKEEQTVCQTMTRTKSTPCKMYIRRKTKTRKMTTTKKKTKKK